MKNQKQLTMSLLVLALLSACQTIQDKPLFETQDFVSDGIFTNGVEGPAVDANGVLYAVNYAKQGTIGAVPAADGAYEFISLSNGSVGNGIRFNKAGDMFIADYVNHNVLIVENGKKQASVYAHNAAMNQPNDIAIADSGVIYASDPNWAKSTGNLWMIPSKGKTVLLEANMGTTNGVEVSPDNQFLYVNESVQRNVWRYRITNGGQITDKTLFYAFGDHGLDGMRCDKNGNLYIARYGAGEIAVLSPKGELIRRIKLKGQYPTNVAFGGSDGKTVYVTMQKRGAIETFRTDVSGRSHAMKL